MGVATGAMGMAGGAVALALEWIKRSSTCRALSGAAQDSSCSPDMARWGFLCAKWGCCIGRNAELAVSLLRH